VNRDRPWIKRIFTGSSAGMLALLLLPLAGHATELTRTGSYELKAGGLLPEELWISTRELTLAGECRKDLFAAVGTRAIFSGVFNGDVWCAAENIELSGTFRQDARVAANRSVVISGRVNGNLMVFAPTIKIMPDAILNGHLRLTGQQIINEGTLNGQAILRASKITLGGTCNGPVELEAPEILFLPGSVINGAVEYRSPRELLPGKQVQLNGTLTRLPPKVTESVPLSARLYRQAGFWLAALLTGFAFIRLFPLYAARSASAFQLMPWRCIWTGAAAFLMIPLGVIALLISLIGIPLAIMLASFFTILAYLGRIIAALLIGRLLFRARQPEARRLFRALVPGLTLIYLLTLLPVLHFGLWTMVTLCGTGALLQGLFIRPPAAQPPDLPVSEPDNPNPSLMKEENP